MVLRQDRPTVESDKSGTIGKLAKWWVKHKNKVWTIIALVVALVTGNSAPSVVDSMTPEKEIVTHESQKTLEQLSKLEGLLKNLIDKVGRLEYSNEVLKDRLDLSEQGSDEAADSGDRIPLRVVPKRSY